MFRSLRQWELSRIGVIGVLMFAMLAPLLRVTQVEAAILPNRLIRMSSSAGAQTGVTYHVEFDIATAGNVGGIVVDFCAQTPIIGDTTCTAPTGFTLTGSPAISGRSDGTGGTADLTTFTTVGALNSNRTLTLTAGTPVSMSSGETAYFDITTVTNPTANNSAFYARIYTYAAAAGATGYSVAAPGAYVDAGGIALSTAQQINVTAKVAERLVFCVYTTGVGDDCDNGDETGSSVVLGDSNGVLSPLGPYINKNAKYSITTNASGDVVVAFKGSTLESGGNSITPVGATPATMTTGGVEQFGFCVYQSAGSGMTIDSVYDGGAGAECAGTTHTAGNGSPAPLGDNGAEFAFDDTSAATTYGDIIATKPAGDYSTGVIVLGSNISNSTEAGIYTTVLTFIATGTY